MEILPIVRGRPSYLLLEKIGDRVNEEVICEAIRLVGKLAGQCPETRCLIHGDFGSYNALSNGQRVTAVIDWDLALFGDPLYEVTNLFFWNEDHLAPLLAHFEREGTGVSQWRERILCYQLHTGLQEIYHSVVGSGPGDVEWLTTRCQQIMS